MLNATIYSFENASLHVAYTCDDRKLAVSFTKYLVDPEGLSESLLEMLSELPPESLGLPGLQLPPNMTKLIDSLLAKRLVNVTTGENRLTYASGTLTLIEAEAFEGDLNAELNYVKGVLINYLNETAAPLSWQLSYLNETEIDAIGMKVNLKADNASTEARVEGIAVQPSVDPINATAFKLDRFFNLTGPEFPGENEQLSVTVVGGSNGTHKVTLYNATGVPEPDLVLLDTENRATLMAWNNVTLSDLRELQFIILAGAQAGDIVTDPKTVTPENPLVINATETLGVAITVTKVSDQVAIVVSNVTEPEGVEPPPGTWKVLGTYVQITVSEEPASVNFTIRMDYTDEQVAAAGVNESTLRIHYWNATLDDWAAVVPSHVNTEENYVWAIVDHFSVFALMGDVPPIAVTLSTPTADDIAESSISLTWTRNEDPDFARYEVFQSGSPDVLGTSIANITESATTTYRVTGLSRGTTYYFTVRVWDTVGLYTDSAQVSATTKVPIWMQWWFIATIVVVVVIAAAAGVLASRRRAATATTTAT